MKVVRGPGAPMKVNLSTLKPGDTIINSAGNICMIAKDENLARQYNKVRLVNLENGGMYSVEGKCKYEVVDCTVNWTPRMGCQSTEECL